MGCACRGSACRGGGCRAACAGAACAEAARAGPGRPGQARAGACRHVQRRAGACPGERVPGRARAPASACPGERMLRHAPFKYSRRVSRNARRANLMGLWDSGAMEAKKKVPSLKLPLQHRQARGRSGALVGRAATSLRSIETHPCGRLVRPLLEGHRPALLLGR